MQENNFANTNIDDNVIEIDLVEVGNVLLAHAVKIIFFTLLGALLINAYSFFLVKPTYESTAKMYILSTSKDSIVDLTDLNVGSSLTKDYEELILSYPVLDEVCENLGLDLDYKEAAKLLELSNPSDTRVLCIKATTTDPQLSMDLANEVMRVTIKYLPETMSSNPPNIAQKARIEEEKVAPSYTKFTVCGALIGFILACLYFIMQYLMDDTIHSAEELEKAFGVTPLTSIPRNEKLMDAEANKQFHKRDKSIKGGK